MAGVLDQEEIDALMGGLETGELDTDEATGVAAGTRYNFSRHHYALQRLMPFLREAFELYAESMQEKTSAIASSANLVTVDEMEVSDLSELTPRLATPCRIAVINAAPLTRPILMAVESDFVFDLVNRYFGGGNSLRKTRASEKFSATELKLSDLFIEDLIAGLAPALSGFVDMAPSISAWETELRHLDGVEAGEPLIATRFKVAFDSSEGGIWILIPWHGLEPVRHLIKLDAAEQPAAQNPEWSRNFLDGLESANVELVAVLAEQKIKLKNALSLKKGDVIAINDPKDIELKIGGIRLMRARFGTRDGQLAAQVVETLRTPMQRIKK